MSIQNKIVLAVIIGAIFFTCLALVLLPQLTSITYERSQEEAKIEQKEIKLEAYIVRLSEYECPDCKPKFKRLDVNGKYSYGCLQFQLETFVAKAREYKIPLEQDGDDIYSCEIQKNIALAMFQDDPKEASHHWYTSIYKKGLGLPPPN